MLKETSAPSLLSTAVTSPIPSTSTAYLMALSPDAANACKNNKTRTRISTVMPAAL